MKIPRIPVIVIIAVTSLVLAAWSTERLRSPRITAKPVLEPSPGGALSANGTIEPKGRTLRLGPAVPGLITRILVAVGDRVSAGQVLIEQDRRVADAEIEKTKAEVTRLRAMPRAEDLDLAAAQLQAAIAQEREARARRDEARALEEPGALSGAERDRRERTAESAAAALAGAKAVHARVAAGAWIADLAVAEANLRRAEAAADLLLLRAPVDATVLRIDARLGEPAEILATTTGLPLLVLGDDSVWHVRAAVDEELLPRLRSGTAQAYPRGNSTASFALRWVGVERMLVPKSTLNGRSNERVDTRVLEVLFEVDGARRDLVAGQVVDVKWDEPAGAVP